MPYMSLREAIRVGILKFLGPEHRIYRRCIGKRLIVEAPPPEIRNRINMIRLDSLMVDANRAISNYVNSDYIYEYEIAFFNPDIAHRILFLGEDGTLRSVIDKKEYIPSRLTIFVDLHGIIRYAAFM
jgi:hypothetical protein